MLFPDACPQESRYTSPTVLQVEMQMLGIISSAMAYGGVVLLFADCCYHLRKTRHLSTRRTRILLFVFALVMTLLCTAALGQGISYLLVQSGMFMENPTVSFSETAFDPFASTYLIDLGIPLTLPFAVLGANGFMIWRCMALFRGTAWIIQKILVVVFLSFLLVVSIGGCLIFFLQSTSSLSGAIDFFVPTQIPLINITLFNIILLRLFLHKEFLARMVGLTDRITDMFVECGALIMVTSIIHLVFSSVGYNGAMITLQLLPHVCAISPFLVILRLAEGKGASLLGPELDKHMNEPARQMTSIAFAADTVTSEEDLEKSGV